ncbi:hypothetical protein EV401DRAFT_2068922 [Pisolithus croceorrhizus]|nr:hypothetical protein EV401DRAFT_2068922 [Pisolithus croceorrhizus]
MSCEDADADITGHWKAATTRVDQAKAENLHLLQYRSWACAEFDWKETQQWYGKAWAAMSYRWNTRTLDSNVWHVWFTIAI